MAVIFDNVAKNEYVLREGNTVLARLKRERVEMGLLYTIVEGFCTGMQAYNYTELKNKVQKAFKEHQKSIRVPLETIRDEKGKIVHYQYTDKSGVVWIIEQWEKSLWVVTSSNYIRPTSSMATKKAAADYITRMVAGL